MRVLRIALTGGIATGKSYVLARFAARGVPTVDADRIARDVVAAGEPAARDIRNRFGADVILEDGTVNRARLAERVFEDAVERAALEAIIHPRVRAAIDAWFAGLAAPAGARLAVAGIPLLFETKREGEFDRVIVTACTQRCQVERVMSRDGLTAGAARKRIDAQLPTAYKLERADFVVRTDGTYADTDRQVDAIHDALLRIASAGVFAVPRRDA